jgi:acyl-CoA thioester hydrolase
MFHHLNNPVYGVLIDSIINEYLITKAGYSTADSEHIGLVGSSYCDYFGSAHYPGMINVGLRVVKLGKSSLMYDVFWSPQIAVTNEPRYEVGVFQEGEEQVKAVGGFSKGFLTVKPNFVSC